jgi:hypothetical protein
MRRIQTAFVFWSLLSLSMFVAAVRADWGGLSFDESLIGYDGRGVQQSQTGAQAQPCQSCPPGTACQSCAVEDTCQCNSADSEHASPAPMILNIGPPPRLYSPSRDFGARVAAKPSQVCVVGDEGTAALPVQLAYPIPIPSTVYTAPSSTLISYPSPVSNQAVYPVSALPTAFTTAGFPAPGMTAMAPPPCVPAVGYAPQTFMPSGPVYFAPPAVNANCAGGAADRLDHMLQAIHHLEAAGLQAEADRLRGLSNAEMHEAVNQLRSAEAGLLQLKEEVAADASEVRTNHPLQPVVTVARATSNFETHKYPVQQAGYIVPSETMASAVHHDDTFDQLALPLPFTPQLISVGPLPGFGSGEMSDVLKSPQDAVLPSFPWILEGSLDMPDYR